jgi:hypothetical protein
MADEDDIENNSHNGMELDDEADDINAPAPSKCTRGSDMGEHDSKDKAKTTRMRAANKTGDGAGASGSSTRKQWTEAEKFIVWQRLVRAVNTLSCTPLYERNLPQYRV